MNTAQKKGKLRSRKTIDKRTAEFIKKQLTLHRNIESLKERSKDLLKIMEKVEKKIERKLTKRSKRPKFDPKDLSFHILQKKITKITKNEAGLDDMDVKQSLSNELNTYLETQKKSKVRAQLLTKTKSHQVLAPREAIPSPKFHSPTRKPRRNMGANDKLIIYPIRITEEEQRRSKNRGLFMFPFETESSSESEEDDSDKYTGKVIRMPLDKLFMFPIHPDEMKRDGNQSLVQKKLIWFPYQSSQEIVA